MNTDMRWRKSSYSAPENNCVELAVGATQAAIRDTKNRNGGTLAFDAGQLSGLLELVKGDFLSRRR